MHSRVLAGVMTGLTALTAVAALATPGAASAAPWHNHGLTITANPDPVTDGQSVLIYGQLKGRDSGGQNVILYHRLPFEGHFSVVGSTRTNSDGFYEFIRPDGVVDTNRDWFVVGPGFTHSRTIEERVEADVTLTSASSTATTGQSVDFSGSIDPAHPHQRVVLQEQTDDFGNGWQTIAQTITDTNSNFTFAPVFKSAGDFTLRAVLPSDPRNIQSPSPVVNLTVQQTQNPAFTINGSAPVIVDGQPVTISGTLYTSGSTTAASTTATSTTATGTTATGTTAAGTSTTPAPGVSVTLYGKDAWTGSYKAIASTTTDSGGNYSFTQVPEYNSTYKVETGGASPQSTSELYVGVQDVVTINASNASPLLGQAVTISGTVTPEHNGHLIMLQQLGNNGHWFNVAAGTVDANSNYSFTYSPVQLGNVQLRVQIGGGTRSAGADSSAVTLDVSGLAPVASLPAAPLRRS